MEPNAVNITTVVQKVFSFGEALRPYDLMCDREEWTYQLPEIIEEENEQEISYKLELLAGSL